jgi:hypothetical protein
MTALRQMPKGLSSEKKLEQFLTDLARHRLPSNWGRTLLLTGTVT